MGPASTKSTKIKEFEKKHRGNISIITSTKNMFREIAKTEFGICSGGITSYEFAAMNVPFAIICQYRHQLLTAAEMEKKCLGVNLGLPQKNIKKKTQRFIENAIAGNIKTSSNVIIDGFGTFRVAKEIKKILKN